ncbi:D-alanyl-D-alanine dipeptidase [Micromonospora phaseoli]|uniref:D-alanyl-D-alanine dipeptidase n=1 Tax=Micromonospora phaseoli TaxID=1144548 RepID=A0A1H7ABN7_9ACTN|nr:M15 family metallopeptidase [Micromonospora phaseoli]PZV96945.1 D-alanyl-D-alanine dipeptidase [Micromonospora phaseoli]GIJ77921.1 D-alanyl-D-alanine dipeptidase [Micromonospora phaseoli]SEJ58425.1 D-alanyl-D-alanine dipeptidase [Micromonospora phaseoli]
MILLCDPRVAAVRGVDDGEPLVDLRGVPELRLDDRAADPTGAYARLRRGVVDRLLAAQRALPDGLGLLVIEGYRPYQAQLDIFTGYRDELRRGHPDWSPERVYQETTKFVSPVEVAPHSTGGAVDLTLCTADGAELDMGTAVDATPEASGNACFTAASSIGVAAREHRQILVAALTGAGLVNYPTEWWHWSYGDRYWALLTGAPHTRYGPV